ncbi:GNAT family N-acetyltransferase [Paenibacillus flagellatus]|uniref:GNAT family N-acetyltransferase n=1 Tax=Paenibacillus flagellatus TaxID=2211139 RepID=A0A2V5K2N6_9BACL|nr:GNAT family N-acetyltransferase [Paenibacillus flagellatus]PYI51823.1 GNAT family N-acetyltransferase [Paenibacillus flagellatus]
MVVQIEQLTSVDGRMAELAELLIRVVEDGASIGFLPPLDRHEAERFWGGVIRPDALLWVAVADGRIVGSVQLHLCTKPNGLHRAEIAKLMTHPVYRRNGIGRALMRAAEERAKLEGRTLLVLDTREGDPSNLLYASLGFVRAGRIPGFAKSATGEFDATVLYYKAIE